MAERANMPLFVPRTVATFERAATVLARRVAAPVRTMAGRALSFADRVLGTWAGTHSPTVSGFAAPSERPAMRAAERGGYGMVMPRPWYEVAAETPVAGDEEGAWAPSSVAQPSTTTVTAPRVTPAAERGAAIPRTALTAPPEVVQRGDAPAAATPRPTTTSASQPAAPARVDRPMAPTAGATTASEPATSSSGAAAEDMRVLEALGLREFAPPPVAIVAPQPMLPPTPLARALAHTAWVDAQLRGLTTPIEAQPRALGGYVFVAPADAERAPQPGRDVAPPSFTAPRSMVQPASTAMPSAPVAAGAPAQSSPSFAAPAFVAPAFVAPSVTAQSWSAAMPDQRLPATLPTMIAQRVAEFVARLVGVQTARDATPVEPEALAAAPASISTRVPARSFVTAGPERPTATAALPNVNDTTARPAASFAAAYVPAMAPVPVSTASWRPGATAARFEQIGAMVDARVSAAWGAATPVAPARTVPGVETTYVTSAPEPVMRAATGAARLSQFMEKLVGVQAIRATAPLPLQSLAVTPSAPVTAGAMPTALSFRAPARVAVTPMMMAAVTPAEQAAHSLMAPPATTQALEAQQPTRAEIVAAALSPGGIGLRAEQMGGFVGVRAASLSIDFVDPARLAMLSAAAPSMPTVAPVIATRSENVETPAAETIMPAPRRLFAPAAPTPSVASRALTAEEWSLVATFPSTATAVQMVGARQAAEWQDLSLVARAASVGPQTLLTVGPDGPAARIEAAGVTSTATRGEAPMLGTRATRMLPAQLQGEAGRTQQPQLVAAAARGSAPREYVVPSLPAAPAAHGIATSFDASSARLPGGRMPRGSFTWPKLADFTSAASDFTTSTAVTVAEQAVQASPGMPLWGSMPALITISPSLAAANASSDSVEAQRTIAGAAATVRASAAPGAAATTTPAGGTGAGMAAARTDAPTMTLMTAAATREARAALRAGGSDAAGDFEARSAAPMTLTGGAVDATQLGGESTGSVRGVSNVRRAQAMPLMSASSQQNGGAAPTGPAARALELARPFLRMVEGADAARSSTPRFYEQPQPLVSGAPSNDSATRIVEALRSQPAATPSDDRVTLADLTLIAIASATQQVAASPAGGGPSAGAPSGGGPSGGGGGAAGGGGAKSGNPAQEIEELARAAFDELQRLITIARERSGDHG